MFQTFSSRSRNSLSPTLSVSQCDLLADHWESITLISNNTLSPSRAVNSYLKSNSPMFKQEICLSSLNACPNTKQTPYFCLKATENLRLEKPLKSLINPSNVILTISTAFTSFRIRWILSFPFSFRNWAARNFLTSS